MLIGAPNALVLLAFQVWPHSGCAAAAGEFDRCAIRSSHLPELRRAAALGHRGVGRSQARLDGFGDLGRRGDGAAAPWSAFPHPAGPVPAANPSKSRRGGSWSPSADAGVDGVEDFRVGHLR